MIPEENPDEWMADNNKRNLSFVEQNNTPSAGSLSLPIQPQNNPSINGLRKSSPAAPISYMDRYSPCGSSPGDNQVTPGGYMLMSPGADIGRRSVKREFFSLLRRFYQIYLKKKIVSTQTVRGLPAWPKTSTFLAIPHQRLKSMSI